MATQVTDYFKADIERYLEGAAAFDETFAERYRREDKSLDECLDYIVTQVQKSGRKGFHDDEIYSLAIHYYQEDNLEEITKGVSGKCQVVTNHTIELTEEEKEEAKRKALDEITQAEIRKIQAKEKRDKERAKAKAEEEKKRAEQEGALFLF